MGKEEAIVPAVSILVALLLAAYATVRVSPYFVLAPSDIDLKDYSILKFDASSIGIKERSGYDHVVGAILRNGTLGVTYYFESKRCSDGIVITSNLNPPQDWSIYDYVLIDVFGDNSNNTLQFWYRDAVSGKMINIGQVTLNWFGWRRLSFYLLPVYERDSVVEFKALILHEDSTVENKTYTIYISSPILLENLKGKLNLVYGGWKKTDKIKVNVYDTGELKIMYNFTSPDSYSVRVDRIFRLHQDFSEYTSIKARVYGDGSNNTLEFWYDDVGVGHPVNIGQVTLNWRGWRELTFELPDFKRNMVKRFSIVIVYGKVYKQFSKERRGNILSSGTVRIVDLRFANTPEIRWKVLPVLIYLLGFILLRLPLSNVFKTSALYLVLALPFRILGYTIVSNDLAQIAYYLTVIGTLILVAHVLYLRILKRNVEVINGELVGFDYSRGSYMLKVQSGKSTAVILKKPYDPHWRISVYLGGRLIKKECSIPYNGINKFRVAVEGTAEVIIRYEK